MAKRAPKWNVYFRPSHRFEGAYELFFFVRDKKNNLLISQRIRLTWNGSRFMWGDTFYNVAGLGMRSYSEIVHELERLEKAIPSVFGNIVDQFNVTSNMFIGGKNAVRSCPLSMDW